MYICIYIYIYVYIYTCVCVCMCSFSDFSDCLIGVMIFSYIALI